MNVFDINNSQNGKPVTEQESGSESVSINGAARINNVSCQAIYVAIKLRKLKAHKESNRWVITFNDLEDYLKQKYSRSKSMFEGKLLFDNAKGYYSVNQVAKLLEVPAQKIYYATRVGLLKAIRKRKAWVIHINDVKAYQEKYQIKASTLVQAG